MENLTKDYWDSMVEYYPLGAQKFQDWIDTYKARNCWGMLFNSHSDYQNADGKNAKAPKYHDLPMAMQIGIWIEFVTETSTAYQWEIFNVLNVNWKQEIETYLAIIQHKTNATK